MEINKQLFEDVLSGKLKGTFVLRNGGSIKSNLLECSSSSSCPYAFRLRCHLYTSTGFADRLNPQNCNYDIIDFIPDTDMKENELTIEIPNGKIVDWDESKKQNKIVLKNKQLTYEGICDRLPDMIDIPLFDTPSEDGNALVANEHQLECILAKNKLANVAKYLNDGWKPTVGDSYTTLEYFYKSKDVLAVPNVWYEESSYEQIIFHNEEDAWEAIKILGEKTVKLALEPLGI